MFHAQSLLPDFPPLPRPQHAPSPLFHSHSGNPCDPHRGGQSGRPSCLFTEFGNNSSKISSFANRLRFLVRFQVCDCTRFLQARLTQSLSLSCCRLSGVVLVEVASGHPRASPVGHRCTVGVLAGTHRCASESRVTLGQGANPSVCRCWWWVES